MKLKIFTLLMLLIFVVQAAVSIDSSNPYSDCGFGECETINLQITKTDAPLGEQVYLILDDHNDGIEWAKNFLKKGRNRFELDAPFDLPNGVHNYDIEFFALGNGKFDVSIVGADTNTIYASLDPWYSGNWSRRKQFNVTSNLGYDLHNFQYMLNLSDPAVIDYTKIDNKSYAFTYYNATSDTETRIFSWTELWNESGVSSIWLNLTIVDGSYYIYYDNNTPMVNNDYWNNGSKVFYFFDDFDDQAESDPPMKWKAHTTFIPANLEIDDTNKYTNPHSLYGKSQGAVHYYHQSNVTFTFDSESYIYEYKFKPSTNVFQQTFCLQSSVGEFNAGNCFIYMRFISGGVQYHDGGGWQSTGQTYTNKWQTMSYQLNLSQSTFDIFYNGGRIANDVSSYQVGTNIKTFQFNILKGSYDVWWDDIKVRNSTSGTLTLVFGSEQVPESNPPNVTLITPAPTPYYEQRNESNATTTLLSFSYNVTDQSPISHCELWVNGTMESNDTTITRNITQWFLNINVTANQNESWWVRCMDTFDNIGNSSRWLFYINTTNETAPPPEFNPPNVTLISPPITYYHQTNKSCATTSLLSFSYNVTDESPISHCELWVNWTMKLNDTTITKNITQWFLNINVTALQNESWWVRCMDVISNTANSSMRFFYLNTCNVTAPIPTPPPNVTVGNVYNIDWNNPTRSVCLNNNTLQSYYEIDLGAGLTNYTRNTFCEYGCVNKTLGSDVCAASPTMQWLWFLLLIIGITVGGYYLIGR